MYYSGKLKRICMWNTPIETLLVCYILLDLLLLLLLKKIFWNSESWESKVFFPFHFEFFSHHLFTLCHSKNTPKRLHSCSTFSIEKKLFGIGVILIVFLYQFIDKQSHIFKIFIMPHAAFDSNIKNFSKFFYSFCSLCLFHLHKYPTWTKWKEKKIWRAFNDFMFSIA